MLIQYMVHQANPWAISPQQAVPVMKMIWDTLFGDLPQMIMTNSVTYRLVSALSMWYILITQFHCF